MKLLTSRSLLYTLPLLGLFAGVSREVQAQPAVNPDHVTFYSEPNFKGEALTVEAGAAVDDLARMRRQNSRPWAYSISSVRVEGAAKAVVYSAPGFQGD